MTKIEKEMKDFLKTMKKDGLEPNIMNFIGWISSTFPELSNDLENLTDNYINKYYKNF